MTVGELIKHLEDVDINTFLREIDEHIQSLLIEQEEGADTRLLSQIQRIQNLAELLNHKRLNNVFTQSQNTEIFEEKSNITTNPERKKVPRIQKGQHKSPIDDMIDNYRKENFQSSIPESNKQEIGDIHFAATILPYEPRYIRELCRNGTIPHSKPAGKYVFMRSELEDWLKKNSSNDLSRFEIGKMGRK